MTSLTQSFTMEHEKKGVLVMKRLQTGVLTALAVVWGVSATQASAQNMRGFRIEAQTGYDSFSSEGNHHGKIGFGGAAGVDFDLGGFVLGPEITYWRAFNENETIEGGGLAERKSFQEWGLGLRAGVDVTPSTLLFAKVAYVRNEQRKRFTPIDPITGNLDSAAPGYYYDHFKTNGWQLGGGINQQLGGGFYVSAEGRYSDYKNKHHLGGTHRVVGLIGLGYLFGAAAPEVAPPPPPPPPPAPATQTCPDGSVIDATAACPAPPPPPPPPPAPVERGERG